MKCKIDEWGTLVVEPESGIEVFALRMHTEQSGVIAIQYYEARINKNNIDDMPDAAVRAELLRLFDENRALSANLEKEDHYIGAFRDHSMWQYNGDHVIGVLESRIEEVREAVALRVRHSGDGGEDENK